MKKTCANGELPISSVCDNSSNMSIRGAMSGRWIGFDRMKISAANEQIGTNANPQNRSGKRRDTLKSSVARTRLNIGASGNVPQKYILEARLDPARFENLRTRVNQR